MNDSSQNKFDVSIIRTRMQADDVKLRRELIPKARARAIKKALHSFHTLETMAVAIYRFQITHTNSELNLQLIAAMCNEMTHLQDFQVKLFEYGFRPGILRTAYRLVGFVLGFGSRLLGQKATLKTAIWVETKAVKHYAELLERVDWDQDTRNMIEKDQADEFGHINRWRTFLERA